MRKTFFGNAIIVSVLSFSVSCSTMMMNWRDPLIVRSAPMWQARVTVYDLSQGELVVAVGLTPFKVMLDNGSGFFKGAKYKVVVEAEGYHPREVVVDTRMRWGWYFFGNILVTGVIGLLIVDPLSGAMWTLEENEVTLHLQKTVSLQRDPNTISVVLLDQIPAEIRPKMVRLK